MPSRRVFFLSSALFLQRRPDVKRIEANLETLCRGYPLKYPKANRGTIPEINRDPTTAVRIIIPNGNAPFSNWRPTRFAHRTERCPVPYLVFRVNAAALYTDRWNSLSLSLPLCLATARFDCQVTIYSPAIPFNRDAILLGDGIERKGARIHHGREVRARST